MNYEAELAQVEGYAVARGIDPAANPGEQRSLEWLQSRVGFCTASRFKDASDTLKGGKSSAKRDAYLWEKVIERLTGRTTEHFVNDAMAWGIDQEPLARIAYEAQTGAMVTETGFIHHPTIEWLGGSPDGLVDDDGLIEIKCLTTPKHLQIVLTGDVTDYIPQIQGLMLITGREYCDYVGYDPRVPEGLQLYIKRVRRQETLIKMYESSLTEFLAEVQEQYDALMLIAKRKAA